jgi:hypothetical protein
MCKHHVVCNFSAYFAELGRVLSGDWICRPSLLIVRSPSVNLPEFVLQVWVKSRPIFGTRVTYQ